MPLETPAQPDSLPRYAHDCDHCVFLGQHGDVDLYFHPGDRIHRTVIARASSAASDYQSGLAVAKHVPDLAEARRRALERGLIKETE